MSEIDLDEVLAIPGAKMQGFVAVVPIGTSDTDMPRELWYDTRTGAATFYCYDSGSWTPLPGIKTTQQIRDFATAFRGRLADG